MFDFANPGGFSQSSPIGAFQSATCGLLEWGMSDGDGKGREQGPLSGCRVTVALLLPFVYVSFWPGLLAGKQWLFERQGKNRVRPLGLLAEACPPFRDAMQWYIDLWR